MSRALSYFLNKHTKQMLFVCLQKSLAQNFPDPKLIDSYLYLFKNWAEIVDQEFAQQSVPINLKQVYDYRARKQTMQLQLLVKNSAVATLIQYNVPNILAKVKLICQIDLVHSIRIIQSHALATPLDLITEMEIKNNLKQPASDSHDAEIAAQLQRLHTILQLRQKI